MQEWAHQGVTECALQTCAPQKLKIDAGANTSLTRRADPPNDSGSTGAHAGVAAMTRKKIGVSALWWWWNGRTRGSQNALQSCAPQKLKIDAGANTSLTRRANPPEDSGSSSERAGASSNYFFSGECTCDTLVVAEWAHQRVTECALQTCAPQKLKINAGANTSLTRRANPRTTRGARARTPESPQ
jgi:hypothetical protein